MNKPAVKPDPSRTRTVYVSVTDRRTRKSKGTTLYGVTPTQAIRLIRKAFEDGADELRPAGRTR